MRTACLVFALTILCLTSPALAVDVIPNTLTASPAVVHEGETLTLTLEGAPKDAFVMIVMGPNTGSLDMLYFSLGVAPPFIFTTFANPQPDGTRVASMPVPAFPPGLAGQPYYMQTVAPKLDFSLESGFTIDFYVSNVASFSFGQ
jgi:hypothetical protein